MEQCSGAALILGSRASQSSRSQSYLSGEEIIWEKRTRDSKALEHLVHCRLRSPLRESRDRDGGALAAPRPAALLPPLRCTTRPRHARSRPARCRRRRCCRSRAPPLLLLLLLRGRHAAPGALQPPLGQPAHAPPALDVVGVEEHAGLVGAGHVHLAAGQHQRSTNCYVIILIQHIFYFFPAGMATCSSILC